MQTLDPKFLYGGGTAARAAYAAWCSGSYAATRRNPAVELARRHLGGARAWLLLGAGPDPTTEVECMSEADERAGLLGSGPALAVVHDVDAAAAEETRLLVAAEVGRSLSLRLETMAAHGPLPTLCAGDTEPLQETVATLLGYSYANLTGAQRVATLANLRAPRLLLDLPLANYAVDPRVVSGRTSWTFAEMEQARADLTMGREPRDAGHGAPLCAGEEAWLRTAVAGWTGTPYVGRLVQQVDTWLNTDCRDYVVRVVAPGLGLELLRFTRKTLSSWLLELEAQKVNTGAGPRWWRVDAVEVTRDAGHPLARAAVLLSRT